MDSLVNPVTGVGRQALESRETQTDCPDSFRPVNHFPGVRILVQLYLGLGAMVAADHLTEVVRVSPCQLPLPLELECRLAEHL